MKKIYSDTSSVRQYHIYQDIIIKLNIGEKVDLFLKAKENNYEDVFVNTQYGEAGQLFSENGGELKKYFIENKYRIDAFVVKIIDKEDGMKSLVVGFDVYQDENIVSNTASNTPQPTPKITTPVSPPKKDSNGCLKIILGALGLFIFFALIAKMCGNDNSQSNSEYISSNNDSVASVNDRNSNVKTTGIDSLKAKELKSLFSEKKDEFEGSSWVQPKSRPIYTNTNGFYCYFNKEKDGTVNNFRFVGQYAAEDWLFIKNLKFNIDGNTFDYFPDDVKTDHDSTIWEWYDDKVDYDDLKLLEAIAKAKSVKVRFNGSQYYKDKTMSQANIKSIKNTLDYYKALGGKF